MPGSVATEGARRELGQVAPPVPAPHPTPPPAAAGRGRDPREAWEGEGRAQRFGSPLPQPHLAAEIGGLLDGVGQAVHVDGRSEIRLSGFALPGGAGETRVHSADVYGLAGGRRWSG